MLWNVWGKPDFTTPDLLQLLDMWDMFFPYPAFWEAPKSEPAAFPELSAVLLVLRLVCFTITFYFTILHTDY